MGTKSSCKTAAVMGLLGRGPAAEAAPPVSVERPRDIEAITSEILDAKRAGGEAILTIGKGLMEAKALLSHGEWLPWLEERVEFSEKAAQNFMRLARHYSNPQTLADLGSSKALMLLAVPEEAREEFISVPHEVGGQEKSVADMSARELQAAIKARDEALKAAEQAKADQSAAEQAREKISQDMALANERIKGLNAQVEEQSAKAREAQDAAGRLEKELEELRSRPVEVAVEADAAAIEAARKEAEAAMRAQLDEEKRAKIKAENLRKEAERDLENARNATKKVVAERDSLQDQMEKMKKKTALTSSEDFVLFKMILERFQEDGNRLCGMIMKERNKDQKMAEGFSNAFFACLDKMRKEAQE